ncbi:MAG: histidine phosphatase family protein [Cyclobacteriaceae bacterium]
MKTLYIIRHAKSSWSFDLDDHDRPLGFRGRKDVMTMGKYLSHNTSIPDIIISSTASRALNTALFIADDWGYPESEIQVDKNLYHASAPQIISILKNQQEDCVAIFGHNPGLTELANRFVKDYISNVPTGACLGIEFNMDNWSEIENAGAQQIFFHTPKSIKMTLRH